MTQPISRNRAKANIFFSSGEVVKLHHATTRCIILPSKPRSLPPKTAEMKELDEKGFKEIHWDRQYTFSSSFPPLLAHQFLEQQVISLIKTTKPPRFWQDDQVLLVGITFQNKSHIHWRPLGKRPKSILAHAMQVIIRMNSRCLPLVFLLGMIKWFVPWSLCFISIPTPLSRNQGTSRHIQTNVWSRHS